MGKKKPTTTNAIPMRYSIPVDIFFSLPYIAPLNQLV